MAAGPVRQALSRLVTEMAAHSKTSTYADHVGLYSE
jgi:hypothetical protein